MQMLKCEKCYHQEACEDFFDFKFTLENCDYFKDKALIVELPCRSGDILFVIDYEPWEEHIDKVKCQSIEIDDCGMSIYCETIEGSYDTYVSNDFGETVFLTREAAEKALKEWKNGK